MLKITFKNVGQGDSILIEWQESGVNKIAIIDCNRYNSINPVLDHLIEKRYQEIEYLILSHPHYDHYSGMHDILEYFANNSLNIKYFLHTSIQVPDFLKMAVSSAIAEKELQKLFLGIRKYRDVVNMKTAVIQSEYPINTLPLASGYSLTVLSPSSIELDNYVKDISVLQSEEDGINNPNANWLSTVLKINMLESYVLLTSDAEKRSLVRIDKKNSHELENELELGQSPHHGSKSNHSNAFWKKRNRKKKTAVMFSVGENSYSHPSIEAIEFFKKNDFDIYSTNEIGGLLAVNIENKDTMNLLDMFSTLEIINDSKLQGDQEFYF